VRFLTDNDNPNARGHPSLQTHSSRCRALSWACSSLRFEKRRDAHIGNAYSLTNSLTYLLTYLFTVDEIPKIASMSVKRRPPSSSHFFSTMVSLAFDSSSTRFGMDDVSDGDFNSSSN